VGGKQDPKAAGQVTILRPSKKTGRLVVVAKVNPGEALPEFDYGRSAYYTLTPPGEKRRAR